jgi:KUP system potassium uptake protein
VTGERRRAEGPLPEFIDEMHRKGATTRMKGTAVFLNRSKDTTPLALRVAQTRLRAIPEDVVILTVETVNEPYVPESGRAAIDHLGDASDGFSRLTLRYGYRDDPDVPKGINRACDDGLVDFNPYHVTYYLSQMTLIPWGERGMPRWRKGLFMAMARNAASPVNYFHLPAERVVTLGSQIRV